MAGAEDDFDLVMGRQKSLPCPDGLNRLKSFSRFRAGLTNIRLVAVCSPDFLRPDWPMGLDTLLTLPLLQDAHRRWGKLIQGTGYGDARKLLNFDRSALALDAAIGGHGVAIAPTYMVENDLRAKKLEEVWVDPDPSDDGLYISWAKDHLGQTHIKQFVDWIVSQFA